MNIIDDLARLIQGKGLRIVFPEGCDLRILSAASRLKQGGVLVPILLGDSAEIDQLARQNNLDISGIDIINSATATNYSHYVDKFMERRGDKNTLEQAQTFLKDSNYFGTMMVYVGDADGMVSGASCATGDTILPALQIIKTKPGVSRASGAMLMTNAVGNAYIFADVAINISPSPDDLAGIAIESAKSAKMFGINPRVAMLSFSTGGSASSPEVERVVEATKIVRELAPGLTIDGELQFDAAFSESVGIKKMPQSDVAGKANVFIFPELQSGNIGYKIAQYMGGFEALGPIIQGLNKPINDLSRGCSEDDVYKLAIITAAQSLESMDNKTV